MTIDQKSRRTLAVNGHVLDWDSGVCGGNVIRY
jgi:hypothetical protein